MADAHGWKATSEQELAEAIIFLQQYYVETFYILFPHKCNCYHYSKSSVVETCNDVSKPHPQEMSPTFRSLTKYRMSISLRYWLTWLLIMLEASRMVVGELARAIVVNSLMIRDSM